MNSIASASSTMVNTTGSTQVPLVVTRNGLPLAGTMLGVSVTAFGNVELTVYGGVPP